MDPVNTGNGVSDMLHDSVDAIDILIVDVFGCGRVGGGDSRIVDDSVDAIDMFTDEAIELGELPVDDSDDSTLSIIMLSLTVIFLGDIP